MLAIIPLLVNYPVCLNIHVWKKILSYTNTWQHTTDWLGYKDTCCFVCKITSNCQSRPWNILERLQEARSETRSPKLLGVESQQKKRSCAFVTNTNPAFGTLIAWLSHALFSLRICTVDASTDHRFNRAFVPECGEELARNEWFAAYFQRCLFFFFLSTAQLPRLFTRPRGSTPLAVLSPCRIVPSSLLSRLRPATTKKKTKKKQGCAALS